MQLKGLSRIAKIGYGHRYQGLLQIYTIELLSYYDEVQEDRVKWKAIIYGTFEVDHGPPYLYINLLINCLNIDYNMAISISVPVSSRDFHISPRSNGEAATTQLDNLWFDPTGIESTIYRTRRKIMPSFF